MTSQPETSDAVKLAIGLLSSSVPWRNPPTAATDFATAIAMLTETIDQQPGVVIQRVAWAAIAGLKEIEALRDKLFDLLKSN